MTEKIAIKETHIPYGVLHDQKLISVKNDGNKMIFTFEIKIYDNNYSDMDFVNKYKPYNRCDMIVEMANDPFNYYSLVSAVNKHNKFNGVSLGREEFIEAINNCSAEFIDCYVNAIYFTIELSVDFYKSKKFRKFKKFCIGYVELNSESVEWNWYNS